VPPPTSATTEIAGRYRLEGPLGRGGMAEVLAGTDLRLQRPVAVKFLLPEMAARDDIRRRFEAEACAAASFSDPHAVAVYDTGEHDGRPYIVMERLPGETLADRILAGPQDPAWVRQVAREVLGALGAAHAVGLVHRDVKPGNILITADDHAKIADFGIAKSVEAADGSLDLTGTGQLLGTPAYLPPERLDGSPASPQSDLYSLGVVLYEALTGKCPFPGDTPMKTAMAIVAGDYQPLHQAKPGLDPNLVTAVERAMATDPNARFPSAAAMAAAMTEAGAGATIPLAGDITAVHDVATTAVIDRSVLAPPPIARRRSRVPLALLIALVFIAVLVAALNRRDDAPTNQPASAQTEATQPAPTTTAATRSQTPATTAAPLVTVPPRLVIPGPASGNGKADEKADDDDKKQEEKGEEKGKAKDKDD
jgi:eukaryotic-like serine/threonine-protein kinase